MTDFTTVTIQNWMRETILLSTIFPECISPVLYERETLPCLWLWPGAVYRRGTGRALYTAGRTQSGAAYVGWCWEMWRYRRWTSAEDVQCSGCWMENMFMEIMFLHFKLQSRIKTGSIKRQCSEQGVGWTDWVGHFVSLVQVYEKVETKADLFQSLPNILL